MTGAGGLDIRVPIGALFTVLGILIGGYGLATIGESERYATSLGININLWWGVAMLVFGILLLLASSRSRRPASARPAMESAEGRATEAREHESGLER